MKLNFLSLSNKWLIVRPILVVVLSLFHLGYSSWGRETLPADAIVYLCVLGFAYFMLSFFSSSVGLAIMCISMLFSPEFAVGSIGLRDISIRIEDILILILLLSWGARMAIQRNASDALKSPLNRPILFLFIVIFWSTIQGYIWGWVPLFSGFFYVAKTIEFFLIFYLVLSYVRTEHQIKWFLFFALLAVALLGLYTLPQVATTKMFTGNRITAPFEGGPQPSTAGGYMAFFLVILISLLIYEDKIYRKWLLAGLTILIFIPFLFTFSRSAYLAFIGGMIVLSLVSKLKWLKLLLLFTLLLSPILLPSSVKERIAFTWEDAKNPDRTMGVDFSFQERIRSFGRSWEALKINPLIGLGVASWVYPDNQYSRTLHEVGILGGVFWLWIFLRLYKIGTWLYNDIEGGLLKGFSLGYSAGIICILLHGAGACTLYIVRIMEPFWFVSGLIVSLYIIRVQALSNAN